MIDKDIAHILLDVRPLLWRTKVHQRRVTLPAAEVAANIARFPPKDKKPPIIVYDQNARRREERREGAHRRGLHLG